MKEILDYSTCIVDIQARLKDLEKNCLHGVVKDNADAYRDIRDGVTIIADKLDTLTKWAVLNLKRTTT